MLASVLTCSRTIITLVFAHLCIFCKNGTVCPVHGESLQYQVPGVWCRFSPALHNHPPADGGHKKIQKQ